MKFKILLLLLTFLLGWCCALTFDYDEDTGVAAAGAPSNLSDTSADNISDNDDIQEPAAMQQQVEEASKKKFDIYDLMDMMETTVTEMTDGHIARNSSDNKLLQEYASMEHQNPNNSDEVNDHEDENENENESTEMATAASVNDSKALEVDNKKNDNDELSDAYKKARMGRLLFMLTTTTSIPDYVRKTKTKNNLNQSLESLDQSTSDYQEDEEAVHVEVKKPPTQSRLTKDDDDDDTIVSSPIKYFDVDDAIDGDSHQHHDDDDYNEPDVNGVHHHNKVAAKPMPRQQFVSQEHQQQQQQQQNSSEEYYDEDPSTSKEDEIVASSTVNNTTTTTPTPTPTHTAVNHQGEDYMMRAIFPVFPSSSSFNTTTTDGPIDSSTLPSIDSLVTPMIMPIDSTTTAPISIVHNNLLTSAVANAGIPAAAAAAAAIPASTGDKKGKQIPIIPTTTTSSSPSSSASSAPPPSTAPTSASHSRRRLLPHEQLRNYIEDAYIRMPLAVIVDPSTDSLEKTKSLWNDALRSNLNIKIVMVTLNESDIPAAFNFNNTRQFIAGLNSIKEHEGGDAFRGISHAAELVPYDSAVFISTATLANHTDQVHDAAITLLKKRIRLYLLWFGERALSENETQETVGGILGEVAIRSGGEVLHIVGSENSQELEGSTLTIVADAFRGSQEVDVPVDTTLSSLHVKIDKLMRRAVLETPNGEINLKKLVKFKSRIMISPNDNERLDAYVPLTKLRKATVFKLKVIPVDLNSEYSVFIRGERKADTFLDDMIKHFETYFYEGRTSYPTHFRSSKLQSITSALSLATIPTHSQLRFPDDNDEKADAVAPKPKDEVETFSSQEIHNNEVVEDELPPAESNKTSMMANTMLSQRSINVLQRSNTKIEMGIHSQVLVAPGMMGQLYFEVTNTGCNGIFYTIQVVDEMRFLMRLIPQSIFLGAGQMAAVTVTVLVTQNTPSGTTDHITFSVTGGGSTTSLSVNLKVFTSQDTQDNTSPSISWDFGSRCNSYSSDSDSCAERFWSLFITAQDSQTGILRLQATPNAGLVYTNTHAIGSTEPLRATYIATCCDPKISLAAYDVAGNQRSYNIDVRDLYLNEASIAAVTLGALLLLLIIVLIIVGIVWCCRRRKVVLDLPTYRSHSSRSME